MKVGCYVAPSNEPLLMHEPEEKLIFLRYDVKILVRIATFELKVIIELPWQSKIGERVRPRLIDVAEQFHTFCTKVDVKSHMLIKPAQCRCTVCVEIVVINIKNFRKHIFNMALSD